MSLSTPLDPSAQWRKIHRIPIPMDNEFLVAWRLDPFLFGYLFFHLDGFSQQLKWLRWISTFTLVTAMMSVSFLETEWLGWALLCGGILTVLATSVYGQFVVVPRLQMHLLELEDDLASVGYRVSGRNRWSCCSGVFFGVFFGHWYTYVVVEQNLLTTYLAEEYPTTEAPLPTTLADRLAVFDNCGGERIAGEILLYVPLWRPQSATPPQGVPTLYLATLKALCLDPPLDALYWFALGLWLYSMFTNPSFWVGLMVVLVTSTCFWCSMNQSLRARTIGSERWQAVVEKVESEFEAVGWKVVFTAKPQWFGATSYSLLVATMAQNNV